MSTLEELRKKLSVDEYIRELHDRHDRDQAGIATHLLRIKELEEHLEFAERWMSNDVREDYRRAWQEHLDAELALRWDPTP